MQGADDSRSRPTSSVAYEATFVDGTDDTQHVLLLDIPALGGVFGDPDGVVWSPVGGTVPQAGDRALAMESDDGSWWAVAWWSDDQSVGSDPTIAQQPQARVYNSANITGIGSGSRVALTFDTSRYDTASLHSTTSNTGRLTAPSAGLYDIGACVQFASNATGTRQLELRVNGAMLIAIDNKNAANGIVTISNVSTQYQLAAGDYVEVTVVQTSGGALNVEASANYSPEFWMTLLSD